MKKYPPLEFTFQFNPNDPLTTNFRFPTAPAYLDDNYNQKCKIEFVSVGVSAPLSGAENTLYIMFNGISSNQYRLLPIKDAANNLLRREFVNTPLSAVLYSHDNAAAVGKGQFNNGNIVTNGDSEIVTSAVWGKEVNMEVREVINCGIAANDANLLKGTNTNISICMRITPFSEEC